jgi:hypothetical protein
MHILDFIIYFPCLILFWYILEVISGGQFTEELGGAVVGVPLVFVFTIIYFLIFVWPGDYNWIDIFNGRQHLLNIKISW